MPNQSFGGSSLVSLALRQIQPFWRRTGGAAAILSGTAAGKGTKIHLEMDLSWLAFWFGICTEAKTGLMKVKQRERKQTQKGAVLPEKLAARPG
jgi:hypothetical protein